MSFIKLRFYHPKMGCSGFDVCRGLTVLPPCFQGFEAFPAVCFSTGRVWCVEQFARMIAYEEDLPLLLQGHSMMVPCRAIWTRRRFKRLRKFQVRRNRADPFKLPVTVSTA